MVEGGEEGEKKSKPRMIRVFVKRTRQDPCQVSIPAEPEAIMDLVGGCPKEIAVSTDLVILCDEDGKLTDKSYNCTICGYNFVGTLVFVGIKDDEWADCPLSYSEFRATFPALFQSMQPIRKGL